MSDYKKLIVSTNYEDPYSVKYFWGRILRKEAESILRQNGCLPGLYLLRESIYSYGSFVLSICQDNFQISHFFLERHQNGYLKIENSINEYSDPIVFIECNKIRLDGLKTMPKIPCYRTAIDKIYYFSILETKKFLQSIENEIKKKSYELEVHFQYKYVKKVIRNLHQVQSWFFSDLDRLSAEERLSEPDFYDGRFLVRFSKNQHIISLCCNKKIYHYVIFSYLQNNILNEIKYHTKDGKNFDSIFELVDCYSRSNMGGLEFLLTYPYPSYPQYTNPHIYYNSNDNSYNEPELDKKNKSSSVKSSKIEEKSQENNDNFNLYIDENSLTKKESIGFGEFGEVFRYLLKTKDGQFESETQVAGKHIKMDEESNQYELNKQREVVRKEAKIIFNLNCTYIIKLIGICEKPDSSLILLEYATLGSLKNYLRKNNNLLITKIIKICYQVALALQYLTSKNIIHRDVAARNVLLFTEDLAKLSDFGLSREIEEKKYYRAFGKTKISYKHMPPEIFNNNELLFSEKTDVWSYGIMFWEAISYGQEPYNTLREQNVKQYLENGMRLEKPIECPEEIYRSIILKCWEHEPNLRPSFLDLIKSLKNINYDLFQINIDAELTSNNKSSNIYFQNT